MPTPPPDLVTFCNAQSSRLQGMLTLYCGSPEIAEELAQEVLARVCLNWRKVKRMPRPEAWTYRVAINLTNSYFRRRAAERRAGARLEARPQHSRLPKDEAGAIAIRLAIARLPRRQRTALVLRFYSDLSVANVAELMDCPEGTVKSLTRRAIAALRKELLSNDFKEETHVV